MIVLGVSETHCATAAILRDGEIVGCASEERFSRLKNDAGYPRQAVDALLRELRLTAADIDVVALAGLRAYSREWMNRVLHDAAYAREYYGVGLDERRGLARRARKLGARLGLIEPARGRLARVLLLVRDAAARDEVRRARVQGDGPGSVCVRRSHRASGAEAPRGLRARRGHARPLRVEAPGPEISAAPRGHAGAAVRRHRRRRPAPRGGDAPGVDAPDARARSEE